MAAIGAKRVVDARAALPKLDFVFLFCSIGLIGIGLVALYSEGLTRDGGANFRRQLLNILLGLGPFAAFLLVPPNFWRRCWKLIYVVNMGLLLAVLAYGASKKGAERWIPIGPIQFQPSELSKLLIVITLAAFLAGNYDHIKSPGTFLLAGLHVALPVVLILMQPHLGAAMVIIAAWLAVCVVGGVPMKFLGFTAGAIGLLALLLVAVPSTRNLVLRDYQRKRIEGLSNRGADRKGANYQTDRAAIAFGVGGFAGTGFQNGEQKRGHFIPEQHNDFVMTVIGEEFGLLGCTILLGLFGLFFLRCWLAIYHSVNPYFRMIAAGVLTVIAFHAVVNMAMVLQIVPVVGLWLPFVSYGGTAMWLCMGCVGLILNLRMRERPILF